MALTKDQEAKLLLQTTNVPISEIEQDKRDTQKELDDYHDELKILMRNPPRNKVRIYFLNGHIGKGEEFIKKLDRLLELRMKSKDAGGGGLDVKK